MLTALSRSTAIASLERESLRNVVLLKHLTSFADGMTTFRVVEDIGTAHLLLLDTRASPYDRATYPAAAYAALVTSDHPTLTTQMLDAVPLRQGVVFKATQIVCAAIAARLPLELRARYHSFTINHGFPRDPCVVIGRSPSEIVLAAFENQGHNRGWLKPLLAADKAFTCSLEVGGLLVAACFAFEIHGHIWEVGGVVTNPVHRRRGQATRVVQTALALLSDRGLTPRYQVDGENRASLALADKLGLQHFLTLEHHLYTPSEHAPND